MSTEPVSLDDVGLPRMAAAQVSYHVRMAAVFGIAGQTEQSASEAVLAWAVLSSSWPGARETASSTGDDLVGQNVAAISDPHREAALTRARNQALDLQAHFVSTGQHDEAGLYSSIAEQLDNTVAELANR